VYKCACNDDRYNDRDEHFDVVASRFTFGRATYSQPQGITVNMGGWLHTGINVMHRELNPDTVTNLSTNRARR